MEPHIKTLAFLLLISLLTVSGCKKEAAPGGQEQTSTPQPDEIIRIPVVVHVLYSAAEHNISDEKIRSQIAVLNKDFRKLNADHLKTPQHYKHLVADVGIEFYLATMDPEGRPTSGITRTSSSLSGYNGKVRFHGEVLEELPLYHTAKGGRTAWDTERYLNIWVAEMTDRHGEVALAGYAQLPGAPKTVDGVVIDPRCLGTLPPLTSEQNLGRTATHEIGHWLGLKHIFQVPDDGVEDTPAGCIPGISSLSPSYCGTEDYPGKKSQTTLSDCGTSPMYMNFMNYVPDESMYLFTKGQAEKMRGVFAAGAPRSKLYQNLKRMDKQKSSLLLRE